MSLLNAEPDPLLEPLPPMEPLQCENMLSEARLKQPPPPRKPRAVKTKDRPVQIDAGAARGPRQRATPDISHNRSPDTLVKPPLPRNIERNAPSIRSKGSAASAAEGARAAKHRVLQRKQEEEEQQRQQTL